MIKPKSYLCLNYVRRIYVHTHNITHSIRKLFLMAFADFIRGKWAAQRSLRYGLWIPHNSSRAPAFNANRFGKYNYLYVQQLLVCRWGISHNVQIVICARDDGKREKGTQQDIRNMF